MDMTHMVGLVLVASLVFLALWVAARRHRSREESLRLSSDRPAGVRRSPGMLRQGLRDVRRLGPWLAVPVFLAVWEIGRIVLLDMHMDSISQTALFRDFLTRNFFGARPAVFGSWVVARALGSFAEVFDVVARDSYPLPAGAVLLGISAFALFRLFRRENSRKRLFPFIAVLGMIIATLVLCSGSVLDGVRLFSPRTMASSSWERKIWMWMYPWSWIPLAGVKALWVLLVVHVLDRRLKKGILGFGNLWKTAWRSLLPVFLVEAVAGAPHALSWVWVLFPIRTAPEPFPIPIHDAFTTTSLIVVGLCTPLALVIALKRWTLRDLRRAARPFLRRNLGRLGSLFFGVWAVVFLLYLVHGAMADSMSGQMRNFAQPIWPAIYFGMALHVAIPLVSVVAACMLYRIVERDRNAERARRVLGKALAASLPGEGA